MGGGAARPRTEDGGRTARCAGERRTDPAGRDGAVSLKF